MGPPPPSTTKTKTTAKKTNDGDLTDLMLSKICIGNFEVIDNFKGELENCLRQQNFLLSLWLACLQL